MKYTEFEVLPDALVIHLTDEGREEAEYQKREYGEFKSDDNIFENLIEHQLANGWHMINDTWGDLTEGPRLTQTAIIDDNGDYVSIYDCYYFNFYEIHSPLVPLLACGNVHFTRHIYFPNATEDQFYDYFEGGAA